MSFRDGVAQMLGTLAAGCALSLASLPARAEEPPPTPLVAPSRQSSGGWFDLDFSDLQRALFVGVGIVQAVGSVLTAAGFGLPSTPDTSTAGLTLTPLILGPSSSGLAGTWRF